MQRSRLGQSDKGGAVGVLHKAEPAAGMLTRAAGYLMIALNSDSNNGIGWA